LSERGFRVDKPGNPEHDDHHNGHQRDDAADVGAGNRIELLRGFLGEIGALGDRVGIELFAAPDDPDDAGKQKVEATCPDDRVCAELADHEAVDEADHNTRQDADQQCGPEAEVDALHGHHAREGHLHRDAHVGHVAGIGDEDQAGRNHADQRDRFQNGLDIAGGEELALGNGHAEQDQENDHDVDAHFIEDLAERAAVQMPRVGILRGCRFFIRHGRIPPPRSPP